MRIPEHILATALALLAAASPALAAPLTDDAIPRDSQVALGASGPVLSFGAGPDLSIAAPPQTLSPTPALLEDSLLLSEEGDDAEAGTAGPAAYEQELDQVLRIDAGLVPEPDLPAAAAD